MNIEPGCTYKVRFPFVRAEVELPPDDPEATKMATFKGWIPGVEFEQDYDGSADACADGIGEMILSIVDVHKPGRFPTRVFYTRQWKDPDGRVFGRNGLHITTQQRFKRLIKGYKHDVWINGEQWIPD